jgi:cobalamin biosynthesis Mg chelatase CobN
MPAKGRRVASRQAQLGRRRRQQGRGAGSIPGSPVDVAEVNTQEADPVSPTPQAAVVGQTANPTQSATAAAPAPAPARFRPRVGARATQGQARTDQAYSHLSSELRRILILVGVLLIVLIGLAVVL